MFWDKHKINIQKPTHEGIYKQIYLEDFITGNYVGEKIEICLYVYDLLHFNDHVYISTFGNFKDEKMNLNLGVKPIDINIILSKETYNWTYDAIRSGYSYLFRGIGSKSIEANGGIIIEDYFYNIDIDEIITRNQQLLLKKISL